MKKILSLFICVLMVFSMVACGNDTKNPTKPQEKPGTSDVTSNTQSDSTNNTMPPYTGPITQDTVRPNGQLPDGASALTYAEVRHYVGKIMKAVIELDVDTTNEYAIEDSASIIQRIKEDATYRAIWEQTIGQSIYLEQSYMLLYKDPQFIFASWLTDAYKNNEPIKAKIEDYSEDEIVSIFERYSPKAPYVIVEIDVRDDFDIYIQNGKIKFNCENCFASTTWGRLSEMGVSDSSTRSNKAIAQMVFGEECDISYGMDYISNNGFTIWEPMITGDLQSIIAAFDNATGYDMNAEITDDMNGTSKLMRKVYRHFYKNSENVSKIQAWIDENVIILRDISAVWFWNPAELEDTYPYYDLKDDEKALIKDLNIYVKHRVYKYDVNDDNEFYPFYEVVAQMARLGAIEWMDEGGPV